MKEMPVVGQKCVLSKKGLNGKTICVKNDRCLATFLRVRCVARVRN